MIKRSFIAAIGILLMAVPALADDAGTAGKQVVDKWKDAVVTVQMVVKTTYSYQGEEPENDESKAETLGTVISPDGLVLVSLSSVSPEDTFASSIPDGMKVTSAVSDMKVILGNGKEIPAKVVLRDKDLDLAFVRTTAKPETPLVCFDLSKSGKAAIFDNIILVSRLGSASGRSVMGVCDRVQAVVEKPRTFYVPGPASSSASMGAPVFSMDGSLVGFLLVRALPKGVPDMAGGPMSGRMGMSVVLPADEVLEVSKQAPAK